MNESSVLRLVRPLSHQRPDNIEGAITRMVWVSIMLGITTMNLALAVYAETLKGYGVEK